MSFATSFQLILRKTSRELPIGYSESEIQQARAFVPEPLRVLLAMAGRSRISLFHNRLHEPSQLVSDPDGMVVFAEENQGVVEWAYSSGRSDCPSVFQRQLDDGGSYGGWVEEPQPLDRFLISFAYWNAANGAADFGGVGEISDSSQTALESMAQLWVGPDFIVRESGAMAVISGDGDFYGFGIDLDEVESLADSLQLKWFELNR
ncbi:MAG: hypothetical protein JSR82_20710 [Verrucomicrobia bacterium]|nr:hypothetical protein [Verrucomicrobiota bacterium]